MRYDILDFPTAWEIQNTRTLNHKPKCSSVPGWHPLSGPAFLCDCGAVDAEWRRFQTAWAALTERQQEWVKAKCQSEQMSRWAVMNEWEVPAVNELEIIIRFLSRRIQ